MDLTYHGKKSNWIESWTMLGIPLAGAKKMASVLSQAMLCHKAFKWRRHRSDQEGGQSSFRRWYQAHSCLTQFAEVSGFMSPRCMHWVMRWTNTHDAWALATYGSYFFRLRNWLMERNTSFFPDWECRERTLKCLAQGSSQNRCKPTSLIYIVLISNQAHVGKA